MIRLLYIALACLFVTVPFTFVWAAERPASRSTTSTYSRGPGTFIYWGGGGRGGWLGGSYRTGGGDYSSGNRGYSGGSGGYRGGGPGFGGK